MAGKEQNLEQQARELGDRFRTLMESDKTSAKTRAVLLERMKADEQEAEHWLPEDAFGTLRALSNFVVPEAGFDIASAMDAKLAAMNAGAKGDGFRYEVLPPAAEAWKRGLHTLEVAAQRECGMPFHALTAEQANALLEKVRAGALHRSITEAIASDDFNAEEMQTWFADVRGELVRLFLADPRGMEAIGFTGFAEEQGFTQIRLGEREVFEG